MTVFAGQRSDPFVFDIGQYMRIIQSNQDLFRDFSANALGPLHGRTVRADGTSGVDGFGISVGGFFAPWGWGPGVFSR